MSDLKGALTALRIYDYIPGLFLQFLYYTLHCIHEILVPSEQPSVPLQGALAYAGVLIRQLRRLELLHLAS